ncbi:MAG TPA: hypothetical protein VMZ06_17235 [Candidatus Bathyarchaeia archaeon]|nr:hypothetical protein [Candidatus Bathyarchaeia archaeon]
MQNMLHKVLAAVVAGVLVIVPALGASGPTPIGRVLIEEIVAPSPDTPEGVSFLPNPQANSIRMLGELWEFSLGPRGNLRRLFREGGSLPL